VGAADHVPMGDGEINGDFRLADRPPFPAGESPVAEKYAVTPDYFRAMGMRLVRGRWFNEQDSRTGRRAVIINESFARRFWPNGDAIGKRMDLFYGSMEGWQEIVGVVADVRRGGLDQTVTLEGYLPYAQSALDEMTLAVRATGDPVPLVSAIRAQVLAVDPEQPVFNVKTMHQVVSDSLGERRLSTFLLALFAGLAMLLAAIGIYGVVSYWVSQRTREIGIRTALGAGRTDILRLVLGRGMLLVGVGAGCGLLASLALMRFLATLLFGVSTHDALTMAAVPVTLGLIALAACYVPARRAARVDPLVALRFE
jgi:putative ABC transport system permease protein